MALLPPVVPSPATMWPPNRLIRRKPERVPGFCKVESPLLEGLVECLTESCALLCPDRLRVKPKT